MKETVRCAIEQNSKGRFAVSIGVIKAFFGILQFTSYHHLSSEKKITGQMTETLLLTLLKRHCLEIKYNLHFTG